MNGFFWQFSRVIYIDADMLVLRNIDALFESEPLSATSEINPPILFNR
jgi:alpha-N-acetylglucosamine transferase